jgi:hypothetical protein
MGRLAVVVLLATGCITTAKHLMRAHFVAADVRPDCQAVSEARLDADDSWLWWVDACGEWLACRYDDKGRMQCRRPEEWPVDADVVAAARFFARCESADVAGRKMMDRPHWQASVCGRDLECAYAGGWVCLDRRR